MLFFKFVQIRHLLAITYSHEVRVDPELLTKLDDNLPDVTICQRHSISLRVLYRFAICLFFWFVVLSVADTPHPWHAHTYELIIEWFGEQVRFVLNDK